MVLDRRNSVNAIPLLEQRIKIVEKGTLPDKTLERIKEITDEKLYRANILASRGNVLGNGLETTQLQCHVYSWDVDITDNVEQAAFVWTRDSGDSAADAAWNGAHSAATKNLIISTIDVGTQSTFFCTINSASSIEVDAQISVSKVMGETEVDERVTVVSETMIEAKLEDYASIAELESISSSINQVAEEVTLGIVAGYVSQNDLATYKTLISNQFATNTEGFSFEFNRIETLINKIGTQVNTQNSYIRLTTEDGNPVILIGKSDSPVMSAMTNSALEYRYNGTVVARFTNQGLWVDNIYANQIGVATNWSFRPGMYVEGHGYNLDIVVKGG